MNEIREGVNRVYILAESRATWLRRSIANIPSYLFCIYSYLLFTYKVFPSEPEILFIDLAPNLPIPFFPKKKKITK